MTRNWGAVLLGLALTGTTGVGTAWAGHGYYEEGDRDRNRGGGECQHAEEYCSDDDFSPTFDESPVNIGPVCLPGSTCHFDGRQDEQAPQEG